MPGPLNTNLPMGGAPKKSPMRMNIVSTGALIVSKKSGRILLCLRSSGFYRQSLYQQQRGDAKIQKPATWNLWGGRPTLRENPEQAIKRIVGQQTSHHQFNKVVQIYAFTNGETNFRYYVFLFLVDDEFHAIPNGSEIENYEWFDYGDWPTPMHPVCVELFKRIGPQLEKQIGKLFVREDLQKENTSTKLIDLLKESKPTWNSEIWPSHIWNSDIWKSNIWKSDIWEADVERVPDDFENVGGASRRKPMTGEEFKVGKAYSEGDVLYYLKSIHKAYDGFERDDEVEGVYKCLEMNPNDIPESEHHTEAEWIDTLSRHKDREFPPIVVNKNMDILDGGHRLAAAKLRGDKTIKVLLQQ
jgi:NUDIX domain